MARSVGYTKHNCAGKDKAIANILTEVRVKNEKQELLQKKVTTMTLTVQLNLYLHLDLLCLTN